MAKRIATTKKITQEKANTFSKNVTEDFASSTEL